MEAKQKLFEFWMEWNVSSSWYFRDNMLNWSLMAVKGNHWLSSLRRFHYNSELCQEKYSTGFYRVKISMKLNVIIFVQRLNLITKISGYKIIFFFVISYESKNIPKQGGLSLSITSSKALGPEYLIIAGTQTGAMPHCWLLWLRVRQCLSPDLQLEVWENYRNAGDCDQM